MKSYPPTMRERRRYILFRLESEEKHDKKSVIKALWNNAFETIGVLGASETSFWVIDFDEKSQEGVIRTNNMNLEKIEGILGFLQRVNNKKGFIHILSVTGTIKKANSLGNF